MTGSGKANVNLLRGRPWQVCPMRLLWAVTRKVPEAAPCTGWPEPKAVWGGGWEMGDPGLMMEEDLAPELTSVTWVPVTVPH